MSRRLIELAALFFKLGTFGFGGPAVHIATMEDEVVHRRSWLSSEYFLDLVGATNLIPGPNSTEMAIHIGYVRAGLAGLFVAGCSFILPAVCITTGLAWFYVEYEATPQIKPILFGIKPAVLAIVISAGWRLGRKAIKGWPAGVLAAIVCICSLLHVREFLLILSAGVGGMLWLALLDGRGPSHRSPGGGKTAAALVGLAASLIPRTSCGAPAGSLVVLSSAVSGTSAPTLMNLGWFFLKVGFVLYGSGYVLLAFLEGELVRQSAWLSEDQLLDAIAIGQLTPGPILSTATFIGYVVMARTGGSGVLGAIIATLGIFLPSFLLVAVTNPLVPKLRKNRIASLFLDSVNAASMGLMAAVTLRLASSIFVPTLQPLKIEWASLLIALIAMTIEVRWKVGTIWLVLGGAIAGVVLWSLGWQSF